MKKVLILGNGESRKKYMGFVQEWKDEIWGCNSIYLELIKAPKQQIPSKE